MGAPRQNFHKMLMFAAALVAVAVSALVVFGWHTGNTSIVQIHPDIVPMQYNTALTQILAVATILTALRWPVISIMAGVVVFFAAFITGLQYVVGVDFGIDSALMDPGRQAQTQTAFPGRMAPNTVICFILLTAAICAYHWRGPQESVRSFMIVAAMLILTFAMTALVGYILKLEAAYGWWSLSNIAPQTAFVFVFQGLALLGFTCYRIPRAQLSLWHGNLKTVLVAVAGITITLAVAQSILDQGRYRTGVQASFEAQRVADVLEISMNEKLMNLRRMTQRWTVDNGTPLERWMPDAQNYLTDNPSYASIALMDKSYDFYRFAPDDDKAKYFWSTRNFDRQKLDASAQSKSVFMKRYDGTEAGGSSNILLIFMPLYKADGFDGFLATAYDPAVMMRSFLKDDSYHYSIYDDQGVLASNKEGRSAFVWKIEKEKNVSILGHNYTVRVEMDVRSFENGGIVFIIVICGLFVTIMLANSIFKTEKLRGYTQLLQESDDRYALTVEGAGITLWDWDVPSNTVKWGGMAGQLFGVGSNEDVPTDDAGVRANIPPEDGENVNKAIAESHTNGGRFYTEFRLFQPDGNYKWVQSNGRVIGRDLSGTPLRLIGIMQDVTARKDAEMRLRQTNEELEQFAYIASHDLKAPLRGIDNLAKWIAEDLEGKIDEGIQGKIDMLRGRVTRLERLLEDILQYSRAGRVPGHIETIMTRPL